MKLSICMMVKNEEKNLDRCLKSLQPLMKAISSELIIVDTGSEDSTVEIAKKYTDKVYFHKWNNHFSEMRNITISYAKGEWVLIIDADEEIEDAKGLIDFLNSNQSNKFVAGAITCKSLVLENKNYGYNITTLVRLYKNKDLNFEGFIHEHPQINGQAIDIKATFLHYGYVASDKELMEYKFKRNMDLLLKELEKDPENITYIIYLATQYAMHQDYKEALDEAVKAYDMIKDKGIDPKKHIFLYPRMVSYYMQNNNYEDAKRICQEGLSLEKEHIDLYYFLAQIEAYFKNYDEVIKNYKIYLDLNKNFNKLSIRLHGMSNFGTLNRYDEVYCELAKVYLEQKKYDQCENYIKKVKVDDYTDSIIIIAIRLFIDTKQFKALKAFFEKQVLDKDEKWVEQFVNNLEKYKENLKSEEKLALFKEFSSGDSYYSKINRIRLCFIENKDNAVELIKDFIDSDKINTLAHAEIVYYLICLKKPIFNLLSNLTESKINSFLNYINTVHSDFISIVQGYLNFYNNCSSFSENRILKMLQQYMLISDTLGDEEYKVTLKYYIKSGINYLKEIYSKVVLDNEMVNDVKNEYEAFLIYMCKAEEQKAQNGLEYIKYLRKASAICPSLSKGIKLLTSEYEANLKKQEEAQDQFEQYKVQVKQVIRNLVESEQFKEAQVIIAEYRKIVKDDGEIEEILGKIG